MMDLRTLLKGLALKGLKALTPLDDFMAQSATLNNRLAFLTIMSQSPLPAGRFEQAMIGSDIGAIDQYKTMYENTGLNPVGIAVYAAFTGVAGKQVKLALMPDGGDATVVDYLGNSAVSPSFGKRISATTILKPGEKLWINTANTAVALIATDVFNVRIFDPREYVGDRSWEAK